MSLSKPPPLPPQTAPPTTPPTTFLSSITDNIMGRIKPSTPSMTAVENPAVQLASLKIPEIPFDETLRFQFTNTRIEKKVFAHRSISANTVSMDNNEHLEFVGDAILKGLTATLIDDLYPDFDEKRMSVCAAASPTVTRTCASPPPLKSYRII